jgi:succinate dehydrogenase/fumarate reductase flavoprotein subunit
MAGCFAAIKAREKGVDVLLVDKGYVSSSGQTPYANSYAVYNPEWEHDFEAMMDQINLGGDYLNNRIWSEIILKESYARFLDLVSYGAEYAQNDDGTPTRKGLIKLGPCEAVFLNEHVFPVALRKQVLKSGAKIKDRIMVTDLLKNGGKVVGAVGISASEAEFYIFVAKSVIISTGAVGFKPPGWPISNLTADGDMMAYRAGATITGKEFIDTHGSFRDAPAYVGPGFLKRPLGSGPPPSKFTNAEGKELESVSLFHLGPEFEAHAGRAPISVFTPFGTKELVAGASAGMSTHKSEGIWPTDTNGSVGIPGLFAAGDSLGIMLCGAAYSAIGIALAGSAVTGARAGWAAAENASNTAKTSVIETEVNRLRSMIYAPLNRKGGFSPSWVIQLLQNTMLPYFVMIIKHEDRLKAALVQIEFFKKHLVPKLKADDAHGLRLAIETKNMICNAEMKLKASVLRKESRGTHYREDYPARNDEEWSAWIKIKEEDGEMKLTKEPIPKAWSKPENTSYLFEFPKF